jgi:hypothetical protein
VCPKWFLSLRYVRRKLCPYLESRLALYRNGPKRASIWASSQRRTIHCVQHDFLRLWYIWCKWCIYLALKLTLSPNRPKRASIWASSPECTIRCIQNNFWSYGTFGANRAPSSTETNTISKMIETRFYMTQVTYEFHWVHPKQFLKLWYVWSKLWTYLAPILTLSPNGPKRDSRWPTPPRSSNGCLQNDFWSYGTIGAHCAPILNQD